MIKTAIQQPALPKYRIPVFRALNREAELDITVLYSTVDAIQNVKPDGFTAIDTTTKSITLPIIGPLFWDKAQISAVRDKANDVVVLSWGNRYLSLIPALIIAKFNRIGTVLWGHGYSKRNNNRFNTWFRQTLTHLCGSILFYDPVNCALFKEITGASNCFSASNTIDLEPVKLHRQLWENDDRKLALFKKSNQLENRKIVLHVSRLDSMNRVGDIISAISHLKDRIPEVLLLVIGSGDEPLERALLDQTKQLGCEGNVRFLGAIYDEAELAPWYCCAEVFCYPSNIGLSLMHAFGYSLPVIIGDDLSKVNPEIYAFEHGFNGWMYEQDNIKSLEEAIHGILTDTAHRKTLVQGAKDTAKNRISMTNMIDGFSKAIVHAHNNR